MKIAFIATYPPRKCGIATFTGNLVKAIHSNLAMDELHLESVIIALQDGKENCEYPPKVKYVIAQNRQPDYIQAADFIHQQKVEVCILQHEFGIFGGEDGAYVLSLTERLKIPLIVTLHTILKTPSYLQKIILQKIAEKADRVVVMSRKAIPLLVNIYHIPVTKIAFIGHGVPDTFTPSFSSQKEHLFQNRTILLTFGLLSRNKGIETVIRALPEVVARYPEVLYLVLGKTHPAVIRASGEAYRDALKRLVNRLGLEDHVRFIEDFVSEEKLTRYLSATDIYITPYLNKAQITSGTLSYAVGAGTAVVSTPYWHAEELLAEGRGRLFPFGDSTRLANTLLELLDEPEKLQQLRKKAFAYGQHFTWSKIGLQYRHLITVAGRSTEINGVEIEFHQKNMPPFKLDHIIRMTDDTGIIQHAKYDIPNRKEGYCLDDNARALMMAVMAWNQQKNEDALKLMPVYLSFIHYMQRKDGYFRNFLGFDRQYLDSRGSEDAFGRTIWALGYLIRFAPRQAYRVFATELFHQASAHFQKLFFLRSIANTVIGIYHFLKLYPSDEIMLSQFTRLTRKILSAYESHAQHPEWRWPENKLTYDNALLPLALWHNFEITGDEKIKVIAKECTDFLAAKTLSKNYLTPVGNKGWYHRGDNNFPLYDQQPIEALAMVLLFKQAYTVSHEKDYQNKMFQCYDWFLGKNSLSIPLYDLKTGGCYDGLQTTGLNYNQGAESTLAYAIAHLSIAHLAVSEMHNSKPAPAVLQPSNQEMQETTLL